MINENKNKLAIPVLINIYCVYHTKTKIPKKKFGIQCKDWWCKTLQEYILDVRTT